MSAAIKRRLAQLELTHRAELTERKLSILATVLEVTTDKALIGTHNEANGYVTFYAETLKAAYVLREQYLVDKKDVIVLVAPVTDADSCALQQENLANHDKPSPTDRITRIERVLVEMPAAEMTDSQLLNIWTSEVADGRTLEKVDAFHRINEKQKPAGTHYAGLVIAREQ